MTPAAKLEALEADIRAWKDEPFVSLTPMRQADVDAFLDRLAAILAELTKDSP